MNISPRYQHRYLYIQKMQDFVNGKISGMEFSSWFLSQRTQDMNARDQLLSEEEKVELKELLNSLIRKEINDEEYKSGALKIIGPFGDNLFLKLFDNLQAVDIEDFGEYYYAKKYGCEDKIQKDRRVDEEEFRRRVKAKLDLLEQNKGKW